MKLRATPRPVDFVNNPDDYGAAIMGMMGFSTKAILRKFPGFTPCQVTYRLAQKSIRRNSYRDGDNQFAQIVVRTAVSNGSENDLIYQIRRVVEEQRKLLKEPNAKPKQ